MPGGPAREGPGIRTKIILGSAALTLFFGAAVMGNIHQGLRETLDEEFARRGSTIASVLAVPVEEFLLTDNPFAVHRLLRRAVEVHDDVRYAYALDRHGRVVSHSFPAGFPGGLAGVNRPTAEEGVRSRLILTEEGMVRDMALPLGQGRLGSIHVGMKEEGLRRRIAGMARGWRLTAVGMLALGLALAFWLAHRLSGRLSSLADVARAVGGGDLEIRAQDGGRDEIGRLAAALNTMIEDLKLLREQLLHSGKLAAIGELASAVSHEINNPLNTMSVCVDALRDRARDPGLLAHPGFAAFPDYLRTVDEEIFRCKRITTGLLDFARRREPRLVPTDVNGLVSETLALAEHRAKAARVGMAFEPGEGLPPVKIDPDQIRQVLLNVILNALDFSRAGDGVRVASRRGPSFAEVSVEDAGPGIPAENISKVFDPFFTTKPPGKGTGLGLAVCRRIINDHGGRIEASNRPGGGAAFRILLPWEGGLNGR